MGEAMFALGDETFSTIKSSLNGIVRYVFLLPYFLQKYDKKYTLK
jgi:hypothetical protein